VAAGTGSNGSNRFLEAATNTANALAGLGGGGVDAASGSGGLPLADTGAGNLHRTAGYALAALLAGLGLLVIGRRRPQATEK